MELYPKLVTLGHYNYLSIHMQINDLLYVYLDSNFQCMNTQDGKTYRIRQNKQAGKFTIILFR